MAPHRDFAPDALDDGAELPAGTPSRRVSWAQIRARLHATSPRARLGLAGVGVAVLVCAAVSIAWIASAGPPPNLEPGVLRAALAGLPSPEAEIQVVEVDPPRDQPLMDALRHRTIRALDVLLVTAEPRGPFTFDRAQTDCAALELEGLTGWRLPELGELGSLTQAGMIGAHKYWSQTAADTFGDQRIVWWARHQRTVPGVQEAYAVCVRTTTTP